MSLVVIKLRNHDFVCLDTMHDASFVIFGGTGDLTHRKLMPAFYNLNYQKLLPCKFNIVAIGRKDFTTEKYRQEVYQSIIKSLNHPIDEDVWNSLSERIYYHRLDFNNVDDYCKLNESLKHIEKTNQTFGKRIYYLAVNPEYFEVVIDNLNHSCFDERSQDFPKVIIEKPFGRSLASATYLNQKLVKVFSEKNIYRIDHYLGKEMPQAIMGLRFSNILFDAIWNHKYIEQVQILSSETLGVETRGEYYEASGATRDMLQSHLLQLLSLIAMEKPSELTDQAIRDEKVKVLKALKKYQYNEVKDFVVRGQYGPNQELPGYRQEQKVNSSSNTETFIALKVNINNERWQGVPFYIKTGKRMKTKSMKIVIEFKTINQSLFNQFINPNYLIIKIQPEEGIIIQFNTKKTGPHPRIIPVKMNFCQNCQTGINSPEAYERLLYDVMREDSTLFTRWDEVEYAWKFVDTIFWAWKDEKPNFPNYPALSDGPTKADQLIEKDHHQWLNLLGEDYENL